LDRLLFPRLAREVPGLVHAHTTRRGGTSRGPWASLNLGFGSGDDASRVRENRARLARALGFSRVVAASQVHGARTVRVRPDGTDPGEADVLLLDEPGVLALVLGADCGLALVVDPRRHALALVHSGWRGTVAGALPAATRALARDGSRPADLRVGLGAAIGPDRYEVDTSVADDLVRAVPEGERHVRPRGPGKADVDLRAFLRLQAIAAGVSGDAIETIGGCTYDDPERFFSHRRDGPRTGRHALVAGWRG
jgi:hypothetical protein